MYGEANPREGEKHYRSGAFDAVRSKRGGGGVLGSCELRREKT